MTANDYRPRLVLGIDPGLTGAVAALAPGHRVELLEDLPTVARGGGKVRREVDAAGLAHLLRPIAGDIRIAIVEQVASRPGQGVGSVFSLGHTTGVIVGVLSALAIPYQMTTPQSWKKAAGVPTGSDKDMSRTIAARLHPDLNLSRKRDHNMADALLLARYGMTAVTA
jgi:crossover junction endodeoxyribonuclease RuvC